MVQLMRYLAVEQGAGKDERHIPLLPGQVLGLPQFASAQGHQTHMVSYTVLFAICHLGSTLGRSSEWKWMICDDGRDPRLASTLRSLPKMPTSLVW